MVQYHVNADLAATRSFQRASEIFARCEGAYSPRTLASYRRDLKYFIDWCESADVGWLPASPEAVAAFTEEQIPAHRLSTIRRRIAAINFVHMMSDEPTPTRHSSVRLALRRAMRAKARRPEQVLGLTKDILKKIISGSSDTIVSRRDNALISVGYDSLCRSSELVLIRLEHLRLEEDGSASLLIPRSKADAAGDGRIAYLAPSTVDTVKLWLGETGMSEGPLFRGMHLARVSDRPLHTSSIRRIVKRAAHRAGIGREVADRLSGHSMRIGAAQDMMVSGFDLISIMHAGGWKTPAVAVRYVEHACARDLHIRRWRALESFA